MAKTMIFGLGGFGGLVIKYAWHTLAADENTTVMALDTDVSDIRRTADENIASAVLGGNERVGDIIEQNGAPEWLEVSQAVLSGVGSGQRRGVGRLLFRQAMKRGQLRAVEDRLNSLIAHRDDDEPFRVLVVTSLAGGTGSGIAVPFALWLRGLFARRGIRAALYAYLILPEVLTEQYPQLRYNENAFERLYSNSYAAVGELVMLDMIKVHGYEPPTRIEIDGLFDSTRADGTPVFDHVYCFDSVSQFGVKPDSIDSYARITADCVCMQFGPAASDALCMQEEAEYARYAVGGYPVFGACGAAKAVYPRERAAAYCAFSAARELAERWRTEDGEIRREADIRLMQSGKRTDTVERRREYVRIRRGKGGTPACGIALADELRERVDSAVNRLLCTERRIVSLFNVGAELRAIPDRCDDMYAAAMRICDERAALLKAGYTQMLEQAMYICDTILPSRSSDLADDSVTVRRMIAESDPISVREAVYDLLLQLDDIKTDDTATVYNEIRECCDAVAPEVLKQRRFYQPEKMYVRSFRDAFSDNSRSLHKQYIRYYTVLLTGMVVSELRERFTEIEGTVDAFFEQLESAVGTLDDTIEKNILPKDEYGVKYILASRHELEQLYRSLPVTAACEDAADRAVGKALLGGIDNAEDTVRSLFTDIAGIYSGYYSELPELDLDIFDAVQKSLRLRGVDDGAEACAEEICSIKRALWNCAAPLFILPDGYNDKAKLPATAYGHYMISSKLDIDKKELMSRFDGNANTERSGGCSKYELCCKRTVYGIRYDMCERFADGGEYHKRYMQCIDRLEANAALADTPHIDKRWHRIFPSVCLTQPPTGMPGKVQRDVPETVEPTSRRIVPYAGAEPYIFISYSHRNNEAVWSVIEALQRAGYRVWYDEGIDPGTEWDVYISQKVIGCEFFAAFISRDYLDSDNCKDELNYARDLNKNRLLVYLEDVELPSGMAMRLNRLQAIHKYKYTSEADFMEKLVQTEGLSVCR